eukprot:EG_transcript_43680
MWRLLLVTFLAGLTHSEPTEEPAPVYHLRQLLPSADAPDHCLALQGARALARRERCNPAAVSQLFHYRAEAATFIAVREGLCLDAMYKNRRNRGLGTWPCHFESNQQFPCQGTRCCCA